MRLVSAVLFVTLTGSIALADEAKPADPKPEVARKRVPLRVVKMLPETKQVLLYDRNRGTHVVAEVGQDVDGYLIDEIDDDEVTLVAQNGAEIILTAPEHSWRKGLVHKGPAPAAGAAAPAAPHEAGPLDPYADPADGTSPAPAASTGASAASTPAPATSTPAPIAAGEGGVRVASATDSTGPADPYADANAGIIAFADAVGATPAPAEKAAPATAAKPDTAIKSDPKAAKVGGATKADPKAAKVDLGAALGAAAAGGPSAPSGAPSPAAAAPTFTVTRNEVDTALADFGATAVTFDAAFVADGLRIDQIAKGTILAKLGLEKGDVLTAVDFDRAPPQRLHSLDDAANLYARAGTAKFATLHVLRGGKPLMLKVTIR